MGPIRHFSRTARVALATSICMMPAGSVMAYKKLEPRKFAVEQAPHILKTLGANDRLLQINRFAVDQMSNILASPMVQGMAKGTLSKEEWDKKYMRADAIYIHRLGQRLAARAKRESPQDQTNIMEIADMFLGYGKHFDRLKKYGLSATDTLESPECERHIDFLTEGTSIKEYYVSILTDMVPYVVFSNYLLNSIEESDGNPWLEYAKKYGDLNNKYAKEKLGKTIRIANEILASDEVGEETARVLFEEGFSFEEWFIKNAFSGGFKIVPSLK